MLRGFITLLLLIATALPALAAPTSSSGPWGVDAGGFKNLSTALAAPATAGKTVVVSTPMAINNKTISRAVHITAAGRINVASGKTVVFTTQPSIGLQQAFAGTGAVTGLSESRPEWWGTNGTNDQAAIQKAASSLTNGGVLLLSGPYQLQPYDAGQAVENFGVTLLNNTWVKGAGKGKTILTGNGVSNWFFQAGGKSKIKITDLSVVKSNVLYMPGGGDHVTVDNISASGYTPDDATHVLASEGMRFYGVSNIKITNSSLYDYGNGCVWFDKYGSTLSSEIVIENCRFEQLAGHHPNYWQNPVGVYIVNAFNTKIRGCTFYNWAPGSTGSTRMGYGFYAGDGSVDDTTIENCTFSVTDGALDRNYMMHVLFWNTSHRWKITASTFYDLPPVVGGGTDITITGNSFYQSSIALDTADNAVVSSNTMVSAPQAAIKFGNNTSSVTSAIASNNIITSPGRSGIWFNVAGQGIATGNYISEPNTSATSLYDAIYYTSCYKGTAVGNVITQTTVGKADYGIRVSTSNKEHHLYGQNVIEGMLVGRMAGSYSAPPTQGLWYAGDEITYQGADGVGAGYSDGFKVIFNLATTLTAGKTTSDTSMAVASGAGTANGDKIGVLLDSGVWHWTSIASGGGTSTLVLTAGLPSPAANGSRVHIFRAKAKANVAS